MKAHLHSQSKNRRDNHQTLTQQKKQCPPATIECGPRQSQRERRRPSRFRDYVTYKTVLFCSVQRLRQIETVLIELVFFVFYCFFCFLVFFKRGRVLHNYASRASLNQHVITILSHGPLYTLHLVHIKRFQRIKYLV